MKAIKVVIWDRANNVALGEYSNHPMGDLNINVSLTSAEIRTKMGRLFTGNFDVCPGDVIELRIMEGLEL